MRTRRLWLLVPSVVVVALGLSSCGGSGAPNRTASAVFGDIGDLSNGAQVQLADVPVGQVTSIALDGDKAKVVMSLDLRRADTGQRDRRHRQHHTAR